MKILIDDVRKIRADLVCRTYNEGIDALRANAGQVEVLYLDHDLGDPDVKKTGYGVVCWLEQNPQCWPEVIFLVTANPVGRQNMERVLIKLYDQVGYKWTKRK